MIPGFVFWKVNAVGEGKCLLEILVLSCFLELW